MYFSSVKLLFIFRYFSQQSHGYCLYIWLKSHHQSQLLAWKERNPFPRGTERIQSYKPEGKTQPLQPSYEVKKMKEVNKLPTC